MPEDTDCQANEPAMVPIAHLRTERAYRHQREEELKEQREERTFLEGMCLLFHRCSPRIRFEVCLIDYGDQYYAMRDFGGLFPGFPSHFAKAIMGRARKGNHICIFWSTDAETAWEKSRAINRTSLQTVVMEVHADEYGDVVDTREWKPRTNSRTGLLMDE